jgi:hypothetical protein
MSTNIAIPKLEKRATPANPDDHATPPALTFNILLKAAGLDPMRVKLVRHQDRRFTRTPYELSTPEFELYVFDPGQTDWAGEPRQHH